jgi:hypothetical protein
MICHLNILLPNRTNPGSTIRTGVGLPLIKTWQLSVLAGILAKAIEWFNVGEKEPLVTMPSVVLSERWVQIIFLSVSEDASSLKH